MSVRCTLSSLTLRPRVLLRWICCALAVAVSFGATASTEDSDPQTPINLNQQQALALSQSVVGLAPENFAFLDRSSKPVALSAFRGKPLLVSFIYTGCFQICPGTTRELQNAVEGAIKAFGSDSFNVVSIGFNPPADDPQSMRSFARQFRIDAPNWEFLSLTPQSVPEVTRAFGFSFLPTPAGFDHILQATLLDANGRIVQQIYGEKLSAADIGEPLKALFANSPTASQVSFDGFVERVRILCTVYDPQTGKYEVKYGLFLEIAGGVTFAIAMMVFFYFEWRTQRQLRKRAGSPDDRT
mgnify:CR=1 FL=1